MNAITSYSRAVNAVGSGDNANAFNVNTDAGSIRLSIVELVTDWGIVQVVPITLFE